jgi:hypothetical protein
MPFEYYDLPSWAIFWKKKVRPRGYVLYFYLRLPIVLFGVSYNRATTENEAYYFKNVKDLINNLNYDGLIANAHKMAQIATKRYRWGVVANKKNNLGYTFDDNYKMQGVKSNISSLNRSYLQKKMGLAHWSIPKYYDQKNK